MRIYKFQENDIANGEGVRLSLFTQGCFKYCVGCFNKETWDIGGGREFTHDDYNYIMQELKKPQYSGLSVLGGEPMLWRDTITKLCKDVKQKFPDKTIWLWTGYKFEEVCDICDSEKLDLLRYIDVIVDGEFDYEKRVYNQFRGSSNQRIIHLKEGKVFKIE